MIKLDQLCYNYNKIVVWGCGKTFSNGYTKMLGIDYLVDSDEEKWGKELLGLKIVSPEVLFSENPKTTAVIICSVYEQEIREQLRAQGGQFDVYVPSMIVPNPFEKKDTNLSYALSYALFAEDAIIQGMVKRYQFEINHYIDIGANHPYWGNATILFYLEGASGCLVEPNEDYVPLLKKYRAWDMVIQAGVSSKENDGKNQTYYEVEGLATRNTFSKQVAENYKEDGFTVKEKMLPLISLERIMEEYGKPVDYINIDVEGLEYEIIKDFDFDKYNVLFWNIEKGDNKVKDLMLENGYELAAETLSNWIFLKAEMRKWV